MSRRGFTLLEVVIALVLLATVLVTSLLALGKQRQTLRLANDRQQAISLADALLTNWQQSPSGIPLATGGPFVERNGWWWQTDIIANRIVFGRPHPIVRLQIVDRTSATRGDRVLVAIEMLHRTMEN